MNVYKKIYIKVGFVATNIYYLAAMCYKRGLKDFPVS